MSVAASGKAVDGSPWRQGFVSAEMGCGGHGSIVAFLCLMEGRQLLHSSVHPAPGTAGTAAAPSSAPASMELP